LRRKKDIQDGSMSTASKVLLLSVQSLFVLIDVPLQEREVRETLKRHSQQVIKSGKGKLNLREGAEVEAKKTKGDL